jgi:hypothetical protein
MGILTPSVPRDLYDALQARYDDLLNKYHALRPTHSTVAPLRVSAPQEEPGAKALHAVERTVTDPRVRAIAAKLLAENPQLTHLAAMKEATRLDDIMRGRGMAPPIVPPTEPPSR